MGMFDREPQLKNAEFADSEFVLWSGEFLGRVKSADYGENTKARVVAGPDDNRAVADTFVVYGVLADQVSRIEADDLPAVVKLEKEGRANVFELVRKLDGSDL